jgi:hypothetical protein
MAVNGSGMPARRSAADHPFGTIRARMGATRFQMHRRQNVRRERALQALTYNMTRMIAILVMAGLRKVILARGH